MSEGPTASRAPRSITWGLLALVAVVHLPLLGFGFVYDDGWTLRSNGFLRPGVFELGLLFDPAAHERHVPDAFRPTLVVFDMLAYRIFGLSSAAHHLISILLHLGVCGLLVRVLERLEAPAELRWASLAVFGLLAIHAEAIAVVSFREDLLAAALGLAALLAALRSLGSESASRRVAWLVGAALASALACGAKWSAAPIPALLLALAWIRPWPACDRWPRARVVVAALALALGVGLALAQNLIVVGGLSPYAPDLNPRVFATRVGLAPVLAASTQIHLGYLGQMITGLGLSPEYVDFGASFGAPATAIALAILLALLIAALHPRVRSRAPVLAFGLLGWFLLALPTANLIGMPNMRADRFMYLPSVAIAIALAWLLLSLGRRWASARPDALWIPLAAFVLLQGSLGFGAAKTYVSNATLWRSALRHAPDSARAQALLGLERLATGRRPDHVEPEVARVVFDQCEGARTLDPVDELPHLCLAELAVAQRDWPLAFEHFERAVELGIDRQDRPLAALAQIALDLPRPDARELALELADRGLSAYPYSPDLHLAAGRVHHRLGQPERAFALYRRARTLRPDRWEPVAWGVELALDLGDAAAAHRTWWVEHDLLAGADPPTRTQLQRRLALTRRDPDFSLLQVFLSPGIFADDP